MVSKIFQWSHTDFEINRSDAMHTFPDFHVSSIRCVFWLFMCIFSFFNMDNLEFTVKRCSHNELFAYRTSALLRLQAVQRELVSY
jgi:hypothetical protein